MYVYIYLYPHLVHKKVYHFFPARFNFFLLESLGKKNVFVCWPPLGGGGHGKCCGPTSRSKHAIKVYNGQWLTIRTHDHWSDFFPDGRWPVMTGSYARQCDSASAHVLSCGCWSKRHAFFGSFLTPAQHTCPCMISQRLHTATLTHACNACAISMHVS